MGGTQGKNCAGMDVAWGWGNKPIGWPGAKRSVPERVQRGMVTELGWSGEGGKRAFSLQGLGARGCEPFTYNLLSILLLPHFNPVLLV